MHNLGTVLKFELIRTIKKKSFWIMSLSFPVIIGLVFGIVFLSNQTTEDMAENIKNQEFSVEITDDSDLIDVNLVKELEIITSADKQTSINKVISGDLDAYFYYQKDLNQKINNFYETKIYISILYCSFEYPQSCSGIKYC